MSIANERRISFHVQGIHLSLLCFEENESVSFVSSVILSCGIFSWKLPVINRTAMPEIVNNIIGCHFKIDVMDIYFIDFLTFIVENSLTSNRSRLHSSCILSWSVNLSVYLSVYLSILMFLILIKISAITSSILIILVFVLLILKPDRMLWHWWLSTILMYKLFLDRRNIILWELVFIWRMISLILHPHLLMLHGWPITSILLSHSLLILWLSIVAILPLHRFSIVIIRRPIIEIPNGLIVVGHLPLIRLMVILPVIAHFALV